MAVSFDLNIFGTKYFTVLFYEWETFNILNKQKIFSCMDESLFKFLAFASCIYLIKFTKRKIKYSIIQKINKYVIHENRIINTCRYVR